MVLRATFVARACKDGLTGGKRDTEMAVEQRPCAGTHLRVSARHHDVTGNACGHVREHGRNQRQVSKMGGRRVHVCVCVCEKER